jgi:transcriptional regulator with XRE-family HTH domain
MARRLQFSRAVRTCDRCQRDKVIDVLVDDTMEVSGHRFTAQLPAARCLICQQVVVDAVNMRNFERRVAVEIAKAALRIGDAFRFLRTTLGMSEANLAELLDVSADYIGYWETEKWPVDPRALAVLSALVLGRFEEKHSVLDCLAVLRAPRKLARNVRLHLDGALQNAGKLLQFGSAVFTQPASA